MTSLVQMVHSTANTLRHTAAKSAGTPLAQKIDESSLTCALGEVSGICDIMERLGLTKVCEAEEGTQTESAHTTEASTEETKEVTEEATPEASVTDVTPVEETSEAVVTKTKVV